MGKHARIAGEVEYRKGEGTNIPIRPGSCEIDETALDATISWSDGDSRGSAVMPMAGYRRYVACQAIHIEGMNAPEALKAMPAETHG